MDVTRHKKGYAIVRFFVQRCLRHTAPVLPSGCQRNPQPLPGTYRQIDTRACGFRQELFLRMRDHFAEAHFPIVDAKIETALGVRANPGFEDDRRAFSPIIRQRHENAGAAFLANRVDLIHGACLPHKE
jgi:hypothetical protein